MRIVESRAMQIQCEATDQAEIGTNPGICHPWWGNVFQVTEAEPPNVHGPAG
jgi:hypothetical protein